MFSPVFYIFSHSYLLIHLKLRLPPTVQGFAVIGVRLIAHSKLPIGVSVILSANGGLSLYVGPATDWQLVHSVPCLSPYGGQP